MKFLNSIMSVLFKPLMKLAEWISKGNKDGLCAS